MLHNEQGKKFSDVTDQMQVGGDENAWSCPAMWFDYDRDGRLDLMVGHYVTWSRELDFRQGFTLLGLGRAYGPPTAFGGTYLTLYHNEGSTFKNVTAEAGLEIKNPATGVPVAKTLGLIATDADFDGWLDVVVANDTVQNFLLLNGRMGPSKKLAIRLVSRWTAWGWQLEPWELTVLIFATTRIWRSRLGTLQTSHRVFMCRMPASQNLRTKQWELGLARRPNGF